MTDEPIRVRQMSAAELDGLSPDEVRDAFETGALAETLGGSAPVDEVAEAEKARHLADAAEIRAQIDAARAPAPTPGQGANVDTNHEGDERSRTREQVRNMTPDETAAALDRGDLDRLLGVRRK